MTDKKFTKDDVVVGATVHIRETSNYPGPSRHVTDHVGIVVSHNTIKTRAVVKDETRGDLQSSVPLVSECDRSDVEILDVQPPKPEYVVGGIYPITDSFGTVFSANRVEHGFGTIGGTWTDEWLSTNGWTVGGRVLVIGYPSAETIERALDHPESWTKGSATGLIARALEAEAR